MGKTKGALGAELRSMVVEFVEKTPGAKSTLAHGLSVPETSIDRMLSHSPWELDLALSTIDLLGMSVHVTRR
jgi:hypothetical protein